VFNLEELQDQKATISKRLRVVEVDKNAALSQQNDSEQREITIDPDALVPSQHAAPPTM